MTDSTDREVLASLPRTRPGRRSERRASEPGVEKRAPARGRDSGKRAAGKPPARGRKASPEPARKASPKRVPARPGADAGPRTTPPPERDEHGRGLVGTAVQAAGELAEIGLTVGGNALRDALSRLPHP